MPWTHCDETIQDDEPCPSCGITKEKWTIEFNLTRTFVVSRRPLVKVELTNRDEEPVPREPIEVVFPERSGSAEDVLGEDGQRKVVASQAGTCTLTFPYWAEGEVVRLSDEGDDGAGSEDGGSEEESPSAGDPRADAARQPQPARFEVATRRKTYRFQVVVPYLDIELLEPSDAPVTGQAFELVSGEETVVRGEVGDQGWSRVRGIEEGEYELRLPDLDRTCWSRRQEPAEEESDEESSDPDAASSASP